MISALKDERIAMIVVGTKLKQQHPKTAKVIMSGVAVLEFEEIFIFSIALIASGVAAFDIPRAFALIQAVISSVAIFSLNDFGKICFKTGFIICESFSIIPASFSTFIMPFQNAIIPIREITKFTLLFAPSIKALVTVDRLDVNKANTIDTMQIILKHFPSI